MPLAYQCPTCGKLATTLPRAPAPNHRAGFCGTCGERQAVISAHSWRDLVFVRGLLAHSQRRRVRIRTGYYISN